MDHFEVSGGVLHCEGVALPAIAAAVGTPVYVYSSATMVRHAQVFRDAVAATGDPLIAFAVKANPNGAVLATLAREGLGADVVSIGEYRRAIAAGVPPERIIFSGVGKTAAEMEYALKGGLLQFNLESVEEAEMMSAVADRLGLRAPVAFRINPGRRAEQVRRADRRGARLLCHRARPAGARCAGGGGAYRQPADRPCAIGKRVRKGGHADRGIARGGA